VRALVRGGKIIAHPFTVDFKNKILSAADDPSARISLDPTQSASYIIFQDEGMVKAKNGLTGEIEFSDSDAATVIQQAIDALPEGQIFIREGLYRLSAGITVTGKQIEIRCLSGAVFQAIAPIDMFTFDRVVRKVSGLRNAVLDLNNIATAGLVLKDTWLSVSDDLIVKNIGAGAVGVKVLSTDNNFLSIMNRVSARIIEAYSSRPPGSMGVLMDSAPGVYAGTTLILDTGLLKSLDVGAKIAKGNNCVIRGACLDCNIAYDVSGYGILLDDIYEEGNAHGVIARTGSIVLVKPMYIEKLTTEGTGRIVNIGGSELNLRSRYPERTTRINFTQEGNYSMGIEGDGTRIAIKDTVMNLDVIYLYNTGDIEIPIAAKGLIVKTPDGTKRYRIRVDNLGNVVTELV
jgi:hypothetical protein